MRTESPFLAWRRLKFAKIIMWIKQLQFVPLDPSVRSKCRSACLPTTPTVAVSKVGQLTFDDILDRSTETTSFVHDALQRLVWISNIEDCAKGGSGSILAIRQTRFGPRRTSASWHESDPRWPLGRWPLNTRLPAFAAVPERVMGRPAWPVGWVKPTGAGG